MAHLTSPQIDEIIELYLSGKSPKEIGNLFGIYNSSVSRIIRRNNIPCNQQNRITDEQLFYICENYVLGNSSEKIAKELNINPSTVCRILKRNNIKIRDNSENKRKYWLNKHWLDDIDSQEKAYFLGIFWADGSVSKSKNDISLRLHTKDRDVLTKISHFFYGKDRVSDYIEDTNKVSTPVSRISLYSEYLKNRMKCLGIKPNKSKQIKFPTKKAIKSSLLSHFIRGLLDGDGCICIRRNGRATVDFTGNTYVINALNYKLLKLDFNNRVYYSEIKDSWSLQINSDSNIINFLDWIYKDSTIHLERKYAKYREIKNRSDQTND